MGKNREIEEDGKKFYQSKLVFLEAFMNRKIVNYNYYDLLKFYNELLDEIAEVDFEISVGIRDKETGTKILKQDEKILEALIPCLEVMLKEKKESKRDEKVSIKRMMQVEENYLSSKNR